jgi:hypothetical protein
MNITKILDCKLSIAWLCIIILLLIMDIDYMIIETKINNNLVSHKLDELSPSFNTGDLIFWPIDLPSVTRHPLDWIWNKLFIAGSRCVYYHVGLIIVLNKVVHIYDTNHRISKDLLDNTYKRSTPSLTAADDRFICSSNRMHIYRYIGPQLKSNDEIIDILNELKPYRSPKTNWSKFKKRINTISDFSIKDDCDVYICAELIINCLHKLDIMNDSDFKKINYDNHTVGILDLLTYAQQNDDYGDFVTFSKNHLIT